MTGGEGRILHGGGQKSEARSDGARPADVWVSDRYLWRLKVGETSARCDTYLWGRLKHAGVKFDISRSRVHSSD